MLSPLLTVFGQPGILPGFSLNYTKRCSPFISFLFPSLQTVALIKAQMGHTHAGVNDILQTMMGTKLKLSDLHTSVVIPSYELESSSPFTFWHKHNTSAKDSESGFVAMLRADDVKGLDPTNMVDGVQFVRGRDCKLWEVGRASSAAPTYFPGNNRFATLSSSSC